MSGSELKWVEIDDSGLQMNGSGWEWVRARFLYNFSITLNKRYNKRLLFGINNHQYNKSNFLYTISVSTKPITEIMIIT